MFFKLASLFCIIVVERLCVFSIGWFVELTVVWMKRKLSFLYDKKGHKKYLVIEIQNFLLRWQCDILWISVYISSFSWLSAKGIPWNFQHTALLVATALVVVNYCMLLLLYWWSPIVNLFMMCYFGLIVFKLFGFD